MGDNRFDDDPGATRRTVGGSPPRAPRWAKVLAAIALLFVLTVVIVLIVGGSGGHGPGRHSGDDAAPAETTGAPSAEGHGPPARASHGGR